MSLIHLNEDSFKSEVTDTTGIALVDFWAPWCGPCQMLGPVMEELAAEYDGKVKVCKVNVDEEGGLAMQFQIMSIPAVYVFKDGKVVESMIGLQSKDSYKSVLEKHLG